MIKYFVFIFIFVGCKLVPDKDSSSKNLKASCDIYNLSFDSIECIEFYQSFTGNSEDACDDAQDRNTGSLKTHRNSSKAMACSKYSSVGRCKLNSFTVFFYPEGYTAGHAQTECNSLNGTFEE